MNSANLKHIYYDLFSIHCCYYYNIIWHREKLKFLTCFSSPHHTFCLPLLHFF